jgi:hypothetical protein
MSRQTRSQSKIPRSGSSQNFSEEKNPPRGSAEKLAGERKPAQEEEIPLVVSLRLPYRSRGLGLDPYCTTLSPLVPPLCPTPLRPRFCRC